MSILDNTHIKVSGCCFLANAGVQTGSAPARGHIETRF